MGSKTSKLKDQIAKGILSGMGTGGSQPTGVKEESLPRSPTESALVIPTMPEAVSDIPGVPESDAKDERESFATQELTTGSSTGSETVVPRQLASVSELPGHPGSASVSLGLTRSDLLRLTKIYLNREIQVKDRLWTGAGAKGLNKLKKIEGKIPEELVDEVRALSGPVTHHLERAVRLYLAVIKADLNNLTES